VARQRKWDLPVDSRLDVGRGTVFSGQHTAGLRDLGSYKSQRGRLRAYRENVRGGRMRVIHEVPAPRELASMVRSFLYFQICGRVSGLPRPLEVRSDEPGSRDRSREVSWMRN